MAKGFVFRGGRDPINLRLEGEAAVNSWQASGFGAVQNDVVFGTVTTVETSVNYPTTFENNITGNDFANLPPQTFTWSSASTTGPITITKEQGQGGFSAKFKGSTIRVFIDGPAVTYIITEVVDQDTLTAYYQAGPSQGGVISSLTQQFGGPNGTMAVSFAELNGTPDPNLQFLRAGAFEEQTLRVYSSPGAFKGGSIDRYFNIPANATSVVGLNEIPNPPDFANNRGIRAYALLFDNKDAFISTSQGVRRIVKIENGNTFINVSNIYGVDDFQQAGGSLQFITPFAMESVAANRATNTDWLQAVPIDVSEYQQVTLAFALDTFEDDQDAATLGAQLVYETQTSDPGAQFTNEQNVNVELRIDASNFEDVAELEAEWAKVKFGDVIAPNTIRFFAEGTPTLDLPLKVKVVI
jgi:hypothetical protein